VKDDELKEIKERFQKDTEFLFNNNLVDYSFLIMVFEKDIGK
jgi:hypothetical protein